MVENVLGTFFGLWFALGFTFFSGLALLMLPLSLFAGSEVPLLLALIFSVIGMFTFIPSVKFVFELLWFFFHPKLWRSTPANNTTIRFVSTLLGSN